MMDLQFTKICFKCKEQKEFIHFYKHPQMKGGYLGKCKVCTRLDTKQATSKLTSTPEGLEKERFRQREKYYRLNYKEKHKPTPEAKKIIMDRYIKKYPEKVKAKSLSSNLRPLIKTNQLHHWNYNLEFAKDVIELSIKDHSKIHRFIKYDQKTFMYKDLNGVLLDTKEKHIELINKVLENF